LAESPALAIVIRAEPTGCPSGDVTTPSIRAVRTNPTTMSTPSRSSAAAIASVVA
jgi:hypothetical protein